MNRDWISPWWQALVLPQRWDVCGVAVGPLSVWHHFALTNLGNKFLCIGDKEKADRDDAASLLILCERGYAAGRELFHNPRTRLKATKRIGAALLKLDMPDITAACGEYVNECTRHGHRVHQPGASGTPCGTPEHWAIVAALCKSGVSFEAAWDTAYAVGRSLLDALDESAGNCVLAPWSYGEYMHDNWSEMEAMTGTREIEIGGK